MYDCDLLVKCNEIRQESRTGLIQDILTIYSTGFYTDTWLFVKIKLQIILVNKENKSFLVIM